MPGRMASPIEEPSSRRTRQLLFVFGFETTGKKGGWTMATPLPAVPPPPSVDTPPPPESRDPLADRANAAALDATLSKGRAALFDATLIGPSRRVCSPPPNAHRAPAPRGAAARKMEALDARRDRAAFAHEVAKRQGAARAATAQEFEDVRKRSRARTQAGAEARS